MSNAPPPPPVPPLPKPPPPPASPTQSDQTRSYATGKALLRRWWFWVVVVVGVLVLIGAIVGPPHPSTTTASTPDVLNAPTSTPSPEASPTLPPTPTVIYVKGPNLLGLTAKQADQALHRASVQAGMDVTLSFNIHEKYSKQRGKIVIAATVIDASGKEADVRGAKIPSDNTVQLVVSKPIPVVPNVLNQQGSKATKELEARGYKVKLKQAISTQPKGIVLSQSVPAGTQKIPSGAAIVLTVARPQPGLFISVTGSGSALVTWGTNGTTHQVTVPLPFTARVPSGGTYGIISMNAQRQLGDSGSITCEIISNGRVVKRATSSGPYSICSVVR